jgi:16S rRNA pseudouridine516 synthase
MKKLRLDRLLSNLGYGSRRETPRLAKAGLVRLDGEPIKDPEQYIFLTPDLSSRMEVDGEPLDPLPGFVVMLHKPVGLTCSHKEEGELVYDLFPLRWQTREPALSSAGRLDKDTSGLLLFTDDGALLHRIISPKKHVTKQYRVTVDRPLSEDLIAKFANGMMLEGETKPTLPAELKIESPTTATVRLSEGRYHQVRRMFAAAGNHVVTLHRDQIGKLRLPDDLEPGSFRLLSEREIAAVFES